MFDYNIDLGEWGVSSVPALMAKIVGSHVDLHLRMVDQRWNIGNGLVSFYELNLSCCIGFGNFQMTLYSNLCDTNNYTCHNRGHLRCR